MLDEDEADDAHLHVMSRGDEVERVDGRRRGDSVRLGTLTK
jgi:hypothetical protein